MTSKLYSNNNPFKKILTNGENLANINSKALNTLYNIDAWKVENK